MLSPFTKHPRLARWAVAILLSVGLHGLFLLGLWQAPAEQPAATADFDPSQAPSEDDFPLTLDDAPPHLKLVAPAPKPRDGGPIVQASFDVRLTDPPPASPALLPPSLLGTVGAAPPRTGVGTAGAPRGDGPGDGSGPCALEVGPTARSVVYVVDRSVSMGLHGALALARREVIASLRRLPPTARFQIIAYNREAEPLAIDGRAGMLAPDENTLRQTADALSALRAAGGTDDGRALRCGIAFHPDILYFLTDADDVSLDDVRTVTRLNNRRTVIHTVELSGGASGPNGPLHRLAADNGGSYRRLDPGQ